MTKTLDQVQDPELAIPITDLGLIYAVREKSGKVDIKMTLTSMGCPLFELIETEIKSNVKKVKGVKKVHVELVFDPPWTLEMMSERGRALLGI